MRAFTVFFVAFLTALPTAAGTVYVIERYGVLPRRQPVPVVQEAVIPDLGGLSEEDARRVAKSVQLTLNVLGRESSTEVKPGAVIRQSIPVGHRVPKNHAIDVVVAETLPKVPSVLGLSMTDATAALQKAGFSIKEGGAIADATLPHGTVLDQSPKADTDSPKGSVVTVQVSSGPEDVEIPKLGGLPIAKAQADLQKLGLKPVVLWAELAETQCYVVLNQKPLPGKKVKPGTEVQLTACH
jgi:serine/threonine-protein kinase